ncbi:MAG: hypothetical protein CUN55_03070 [Phototrophicales bacterium]|nr:MAG: hypothetical protein CUN55_03070 [Phototrophicales bacterium]
MQPISHQIRLPAKRQSLIDFYQFFRQVSQDFHLSEQIQFDIELSVEEALTNIIHHAYGPDEEGDFVLRISDYGDKIEVIIQDWGKPFDPEAIPPFDYSAPVEARINGGMGLHFMRTLMDSVEYRFEDGTTILTMIKRRDPVMPLMPVEERIERELQVFDAVARALSTERNADALLDLIVDKLTDVVDADRGTLYLYDPERNELVSKILQDDTGRLTQIRLPMGEGVAGYVAETGETVNITSTANDPHFAKNFDRESGYHTQTMLCTPMRNAGGEIIGVIQLLNKRDGVFTRRDEIVLSVLASQAAIAIENNRLLQSEKEKRQIADRLREVSSIINSSLELAEVLQLILQELEHVVPFDLASILLIEGQELVLRAGRGFQKPIPMHSPLFKITENLLIQEMMKTHLPLIIPDVREDSRWIRTEHTAEMHSWLGAPLIVGDQVIGELSINHRQADFYRQTHVDIVRTFANQAAAAIERARLHEQTIVQARLQQEVETARTIQTSFLPDRDPQLAGWDIAASWQPAKEVAGDFYDYIYLPDDRLGFVIADVCGKGIPASLFMALSRTILRVMAQTDLPPSLLLEQVNNQLKSDSRSNLFVTLFYGLLDLQTGAMTFANGGHNPPIWIQAERPKQFTMLNPTGPALGVFPNVYYDQNTINFKSGDVLVLYTDGVIEAINEDEEEFDEARLVDCIVAHAHHSAETLNAAIRQTVARFIGTQSTEDDATILVIKRN